TNIGSSFEVSEREYLQDGDDLDKLANILSTPQPSSLESNTIEIDQVNKIQVVEPNIQEITQVNETQSTKSNAKKLLQYDILPSDEYSDPEEEINELIFEISGRPSIARNIRQETNPSQTSKNNQPTNILSNNDNLSEESSQQISDKINDKIISEENTRYPIVLIESVELPNYKQKLKCKSDYDSREQDKGKQKELPESSSDSDELEVEKAPNKKKKLSCDSRGQGKSKQKELPESSSDSDNM
ncbi:6546_t:CDS:2, partial [Racocetra persica]